MVAGVRGAGGKTALLDIAPRILEYPNRRASLLDLTTKRFESRPEIKDQIISTRSGFVIYLLVIALLDVEGVHKGKKTITTAGY
jgi:hypothetical protein